MQKNDDIAVICITFAVAMRRMMLLYAVCMIANVSRGQRTCVVADMFTRIPIGNVRVIPDHYENKDIRTNYKGEFDITSSQFNFLAFIASGYMRRVLDRKEIGDTIFLVANDNRLDEVVVYGKDPMKSSAVSSWVTMIKAQGKYMPKPTGKNFLSIFERKVSKKKKAARRKAIENY